MKRGNWKPTNPNSDYKHGYVLNDNLTMKGYGTKNRNDELRKYLGWTIDADGKKAWIQLEFIFQSQNRII